MKPLIKLIFALAVVFVLIFIAVKLSGLMTIDQIEDWLGRAKTLSPYLVGAIVVCLLFVDLFISVPTLAVTMLAGFFLGHAVASASVLAGLMLAGITGYVISRLLGERLLKILLRKTDERKVATETFREHGFVLIIFARALPMLPEITACLAGMTGMKFRRFMLAWSLGSIPYVLLATYAGSISSVDQPEPAIYIAVAMMVLLWGAGFALNKRVPGRKKTA